MKRIIYLYLYIALIIGLISPAIHAAASTNSVFIVQLQTASLTSASEEFITIYNSGSDNIDISTWRLEYFSASAANFDAPTRKIPLHGIIGSHNYFLATSNNYLPDKSNETFSATLAKTGGHVRLVSQATASEPIVLQDLVAWGSALHADGTPASAPPDGKSIVRKADLSGKFIDTNNNANDFTVSDVPSPRSDPVLAPVVEAPAPSLPLPLSLPLPVTLPSMPASPVIPDIPAVESITVELSPSLQSPVPLAPQLSELLPNPAAPAVDTNDEFIELYNPNTQAIPLTGYKLQSGSTYSYSYTFNTETLPGRGYVAFMVTKTGNTLANASGKVRLIDPEGTVIDETSYGGATAGQAWVWIQNSWQWSSTPTPNAPNVTVLQALVLPKTPAALKKTIPKNKAVKAAASKKPKPAAKPRTAKTIKKTNSISSHDQPTASAVHPVILAAITLIAVGYAVYEYRDDIANRIYQFRRNRADRRIARQE